MKLSNFGVSIKAKLSGREQVSNKMAIDYIEELSAKQREIYNSVAMEGVRRLAICGSPGAGKTTIGVPTALDVPMNDKEAGLFVGTSTPAIRELLNQWFRENTEDGFQISQSQMKFKFNDKLYYLAGADTNNRTASFKGKNIKMVYIEEITHPSFRKAIYDEILDRLRGRKKWNYDAYMIMSFNPVAPNHWVYNDIFTSPIFRSYTLTIFDNEAIDQEAFILGRGFTTPESRLTSRYDWLILGQWVVHDDYPFSFVEYVHGEVDRYIFAYVDPSLKGRDKSAITFFAKDLHDNWLVKGFCDNLATEAFLKQGKLQRDLDKCDLIILEENNIGHFKKNLEEALGRNLQVYPTSINKIQKIRKITHSVQSGEIKFLDTCDKNYINDIRGWQDGVKDQCDDAVDSLAGGLEVWGVI